MGFCLSLMAYRSHGGSQVWTRRQATHCVRRGLSVMADTWGEEGKLGKSQLVPGFCTAFGEEWGCVEAGGGGGEASGDTAGREMVVQRI